MLPPVCPPTCRATPALEHRGETRDYGAACDQNSLMTFAAEPKGEHLAFSEGGRCATRQSGVGQATCFVGPLAAEGGICSFTVEIVELEKHRMQTLALGMYTALPAASQVRLLERAKDLGEGSVIVGYDLPKLFVHGREEA